MEDYFIQKYSHEGLSIIKSPPLISTIRINTLKILPSEALLLLQNLYQHLQLTLHPQLYDVICIAAEGPFTQSLLSKSLYVDHKCGEAVLRGSSIYSPGVLGSNDNCKQ